MNGTLGNQTGDFLGRGRRGVDTDGLVGEHVVLLPETLAAEVAEVEAGHVAPLVDHQVVRLGERAIAPTTVKCLSDRANLKKFPNLNGEIVLLTYLERFLLIKYFRLVHIDAQTDSKHVEYLNLDSLSLDPEVYHCYLLLLELTLKMVNISTGPDEMWLNMVFNFYNMHQVQTSNLSPR